MLPDPLHPAIVHFPIVLAVLAPLVIAGAFVAIRRGVRPARAWAVPVAMLAALALSGWVAMETGERDEERVERVVGERSLETHEEAASRFTFVAAGVALLSALGLAAGMAGRVGRVAGTAGAVALLVMGWQVGHSGGALVYRHGAAQAHVQTTTLGAADAGGGGEARGEGRGDDSDAR